MTGRRVMVVTGATGFIGRHVAEHFATAGWDVRPLVRPTWQLGDELGPALDDADVVVHAALAPYSQRGARRLNVEGSRLVVNEVRAHPPTRLIFLSSVSARENTRSAYGQDKFAIQSMLEGPRELAIRPGLVLGDGGLFDRIRSIVRRGPVVALVGGGHQLVQTVHIDDLVEAIDAAIRGQRAGILTIAERTPVEFRALLRECARRMGRRVLFVPVPSRLVGSVLGLAESMRLRLPVSRDNLAGLQSTELVTVDDIPGLVVRDYRASLASLLSER